MLGSHFLADFCNHRFFEAFERSNTPTALLRGCRSKLEVAALWPGESTLYGLGGSVSLGLFLTLYHEYESNVKAVLLVIGLIFEGEALLAEIL